jgi:hypothetical protein
MPDPMEICRQNLEHARSRCPVADPKPDHYRDMEQERRRPAFIFIDCKPRAFRTDFGGWLKENFHVYREFERRADLLWRAGRRHYGARSIWETMRYDSAIGELSGDWKLNDHFPPCCARLWMMAHPGCDGFFETRSGQSAVRSI